MSSSKAQNTLESMSQAQWYNRWTLNKFNKYLKGDILEVGCGIGNFTRDLTKFGKVWSIDINNEYVQKIQEQISKDVQVGFGDIEKGKYFFRDKKFDSIVCLNVLEHIKDDTRSLDNLSYILKTGGFLILLVPAHQLLFGEIDKSIGHYRRYNKQQMKKMVLSSDLQIIKIRILNILGGIGWWFSSKVLSNKQVSGGKIRLFNLIAPIILPLEDIIEPPFGTSILIIAQKK